MFYQPPPTGKQSVFNFPASGIQKPDQYLHMYDNIFRCMYNLDPIFYTGDTHLVNDAIGLLEAATALDAVSCVRRDVETHLLRTGHFLWQRVLQDVEAWADIGMRLKSPVIFRESMIRLIGLWSVPSAINKEAILMLPTGIELLKIVEKKVSEQTREKTEVEERLRNFFPREMLHPPSNIPGTGITGRAFYANDVYMWQALTLVRQYIVQEIMAGHGHVAADGGATFYRAIGNGGVAYCRAVDLDAWHTKFDMTAKGKQRLRDALIYVKEEMKSVVADLLVTRTNIPEAQGDYPYLTYTGFKDADLPWYSAPSFPSFHKEDHLEQEDQSSDDGNMDAIVTAGPDSAEGNSPLGASNDGSAQNFPKTKSPKGKLLRGGLFIEDHDEGDRENAGPPFPVRGQPKNGGRTTNLSSPPSPKRRRIS